MNSESYVAFIPILGIAAGAWALLVLLALFFIADQARITQWRLQDLHEFIAEKLAFRNQDPAA